MSKDVDYGVKSKTGEKHNGVTVYEGQSEALSDAYYEGRRAKSDGLPLSDNPYRQSQMEQRGDWWIGHCDEGDGVSVEQRLEAERNGRNI